MYLFYVSYVLYWIVVYKIYWCSIHPKNLNLTLSLFNQDNSYSCIREKTFLQNAFPCYPRLL